MDAGTFVDEINDILSSGQGSPVLDNWHERELTKMYTTIPEQLRDAVWQGYVANVNDMGVENMLQGEVSFMANLFKKPKPRFTENITENKMSTIKEKQIALVEAKIEKLTGKKVVYKEAEVIEESHTCTCKKHKLSEAKDDDKKEDKAPKEDKEAKAPVAKADGESASVAATANADEPILGNIIPTSVIKQIDAYVSDTLAEIDKTTTQLRAIKRQISSGATATNEDFSTSTERIAFLVKQLSRISLYTSNTIKAGKFDKTLLDKIFDQKGLNTPTV